MFIVALFTIAKVWKQPKRSSVFIDRLMDKEYMAWNIYIYNGILLSHQEEWNFAICNNMDGLEGHYAKGKWLDRERQILSLICGI